MKHGDTMAIPMGNGTGGSRSVAVGGSSVYNATLKVQAKARQHFRVESPLIEEREQRGQDLAGAGLTGLRQEVEVDDHGVQIPRVTGLVIFCYATMTVTRARARLSARTRA